MNRALASRALCTLVLSGLSLAASAQAGKSAAEMVSLMSGTVTRASH